MKRNPDYASVRSFTPPVWRIQHFPVLASTNDLALNRIRENRAVVGDVLVAAEQAAGRGRPGRAWSSPPGSLAMTAVLPFWPAQAGWTALAAGIAAAGAVRSLCGECGVKWPNDLILQGRKLGGILTEAACMDLVAVGIGMNVCNPLPTDPALAGRTASLCEVLPDVTVPDVLAAVLDALSDTWAHLAAGDRGALQKAWTRLDVTRGRTVIWSREGRRGVAAGIDETGGLRILGSNGEVLIATVGEICFEDAAPAENEQ